MKLKVAHQSSTEWWAWDDNFMSLGGSYRVLEPTFVSTICSEEQEKRTTNSRCLDIMIVAEWIAIFYVRTNRTPFLVRPAKNDIRQRHHIWLNYLSVKLSKSIMFFDLASWWLFFFFHNTHTYKKKLDVNFLIIQGHSPYGSITEHIKMRKRFLLTHQILIYIDRQLETRWHN